MILFLQLLLVLVPAVVAAIIVLADLATLVAVVVHAGRATIPPWHPILAAVLAATAIALAVAFGWVPFR